MQNKIFSFVLNLVFFICPLVAEEVEVVKPSTSFAREVLQPIGMPVVAFWYSMRENVFLNYAQQEATGLEALGDWMLTPYRYLMGGSDVISSRPGYSVIPSCNYRKHDILKTTLSLIVLPFSTLAGTFIKGISYLSPSSRAAYKNLKTWKKAFAFSSQNLKYNTLGIRSLFSNDFAPCLHLARPSKLSETHLIELEALKEMCALLKQHDIVFWLDCGSALGAYRYQGMIPWDDDIDLSIIADDHHNIKKLLQKLDPNKYQLQDWSSYLHPQTFFKFYIKKTKTFIDIYHYVLDPPAKHAAVFYTYKDTPLPKKWKHFEEVLTEPVPYDVIFPLKKAHFDGIEVWVPNDLKKFLNYKYGENLSPTMIWDEASQSYLKVKNHPYWKVFE